MRWLANVCYSLAAVLYLPILIYQMLVQKKNRRGWRERCGHIEPRTTSCPCIWIHGVSLGEINATRQLVSQLRQRLPQAEIVVSSTTDTGFARARALFPDLRVFRYPLDFSWTVSRTLHRIRPQMIILMELEVWFNLIMMAAAQGVQICVANGRLTARSSARFRWLGYFGRQMFSRLTWVGAQTDEIAGRFRMAGVCAARVQVVGSMKWDTAEVTDHIEGSAALAEALNLRADRALIVLGSSGPGEEQLVLASWEQLIQAGHDVALAVVPRKPERFDEVARLIERAGFRCIRRSGLPDEDVEASSSSGHTVILGDTMGELRKFYCLADIVIVGRSFVPMGGSDPMEAAALSKALIAGPHMDNFKEPTTRLLSAGGLILANTTSDLANILGDLLATSERRDEMGRRALRVVLDNQGATARTVDALCELLVAAKRPIDLQPFSAQDNRGDSCNNVSTHASSAD